MEENKFAESFLDFSGMPESMEDLLNCQEGAGTINKGNQDKKGGRRSGVGRGERHVHVPLG